MAKLTTKVKVSLQKSAKNQVLNAILSSKQFQKEADKRVAQKAAKAVAEHVESYARAAVQGTAEVLQGSVSGDRNRKQLTVATPAGNTTVKLPEPRDRSSPGWPGLSASYRQRKGNNFFWLQKGLVYERFLGTMLQGYAQKKFTSYRTRMIRKPGRPEFDLALSVELKKLPNPYDDLVRRPFVSGAQNGNLPVAPKFRGKGQGSRQGVNRILWPENQRPLLRPIAYRLGRLTLQNFRKTLEI